jgi:hypothetical protein
VKRPRLALAPAKPAHLIVSAIETDARRVFVGNNAALMDELCRFSSDYAARAIAKKMRALLPA